MIIVNKLLTRGYFGVKKEREHNHFFLAELMDTFLLQEKDVKVQSECDCNSVDYLYEI